ncbi:hypothetical protein RMCBS344292_10912 [Rhizopus microsporus]|nr:hypothetical protein RMCBS344292_10912 [Rhizopus microsporus]
MSYSSYNSYIFQTNLKVLIGILATHQIISAFNIFLLKKLLHSQIVHVLETLIVIRCCYNIWRSTKHISSPVVAPFTSSFKNYLLVPGPVTKTITDFYDRLFKPSKKSTSTPPQPKIEQPTKVVDAFRIAQEIIPKYEVKQNDPTPIKSKGTKYMGAFEHMVETIKHMMEEEEQRRREEKEKNKVKGMPSDGEIVFYIFHTYLQLREPHIIPPLLPLEGDVFKFLLVYFKITPELSWGVF